MKLWAKNTIPHQKIEEFTIGKDRELDVHLAKADILGSLAHIKMLESINLLQSDELEMLTQELRAIYSIAQKGEFTIEEGVEDVHSQVEMMLSKKLGDPGKKIHSGRSRNDQVLVDLKIYTRAEIMELVTLTNQLFQTLIDLSNTHKDVLLPGYTHLQVAMPSSFGLWFGAYAESLVDDLQMLLGAFKLCNRNPLGSAAGYGSSFPLNRSMTTELLGFDSMNYNVVYAQMGRGKMEKNVSFAIAGIASTLARFAMDACLFMSQNFGFISLPAEYTTGSSIMPHKKNPDVFELIRGKCNKIQGVPSSITHILNNLPSGYFRDMQIIKEVMMPIFDEMKDCLLITNFIVSKIIVNTSILDDDKYKYLFSVETVNKLVQTGVPFRDAYKQVGLQLESEDYSPNKTVNHTHEGSIGNLCNNEISELMNDVIQQFGFDKIIEAEHKLLGIHSN